MSTVGIIAEFNPFHKGHSYLIDRAREVTGADRVVVVMSGDFVQRGEPAVCDKFTRARMALECGADLVFELPVCYAAAGAGAFAEGAVRMLCSMGCIDYICFGAECGDAAELEKLGRFFAQESEDYRQLLRAELKKGSSYPAARAAAYAAYRAGQAEGRDNGRETVNTANTANTVNTVDTADTADTVNTANTADTADADMQKYSEILQGPNNILAIEYFRILALLEKEQDEASTDVRKPEAQKREAQNTTAKNPDVSTPMRCLPRPVVIKRIGSDYGDSEVSSSGFSSAAALRKIINSQFNNHQNTDDFTGSMKGDKSCTASAGGDLSRILGENMPEKAALLLQAEMGRSCPINGEDMAALVFYALNNSDSEQLKSVEGISPDLAERIMGMREQPLGFYEAAMGLKTKNLTYTAACRALLHLVLGVKKGMGAEKPVYARLLGFRKEASGLVGRIAEEGSLLLINKLASAPIRDNASLQLDIRAGELYRELVFLKYGCRLKGEYEQGPVIV